MVAKIKGKKYEATKDLDIAEIAKLVRQELKELLGAYKISVRVHRYSMGQAINVWITGTQTEERSTEAKKIEAQARQVLDQYNYDDSDSLSDYYDVRFASNVRVLN